MIIVTAKTSYFMRPMWRVYTVCRRVFRFFTSGFSQENTGSPCTHITHNIIICNIICWLCRHTIFVRTCTLIEKNSSHDKLMTSYRLLFTLLIWSEWLTRDILLYIIEGNNIICCGPRKHILKWVSIKKK